MGIEPETRDFLLRIINTLSFTIIWMISNMYLGIVRGYAFFAVDPGWKNWLFYFFSLISLLFLLRYLWKKWH